MNLRSRTPRTRRPGHVAPAALLTILSSAGLFGQSPPTVGTGSASPASGAGPTTFTVSASDAGGAAAISYMQMLVDWSPDGSNACYVMYTPSGGLYLAMDEGGWLGPSAPGTGAPLSNDQCTLNAAATTVSSAGNTVTVNPVVTFNSSFVGTMGVYVYASDAVGNNSGWQQVLTYTTFPASSQLPTATVTPNAGTGMSKVFTVNSQDVNGWKYLGYQQLLIGPSDSNAANSCLVILNGEWGGMLFLINDADTQWLGPAFLNSPATLSNHQCSINSGAATMTPSGNNLTFNIGVSFAASGGFPVNQAQNVYLDITDQAGHSTGWLTEGTWTVGTPPPTIGTGSAGPASGAGPTTFTVSASDGGGAAAISYMQMLVDWSPDGSNACYLMYAPSGGLYLAGDQGGWTGPSAPGTGAPLSNGQCTLNAAATTVSSAGNTVTVNPVVTFNSTFVGTMGVYVYASDAAGNNSGWQQVLTYVTFPASTQLPTGTVTPNAGTGMSQVFAVNSQDVNGWKYLGYQELLIGPASGNAANSCLVILDGDWGGTLYLMNDANTQWLGPAFLSSPATVSNHQCSINSGATTITTSGNNLTFKLSVSFPASGGFPVNQSQNLYLVLVDQAGHSTGWLTEGGWTVGTPAPISITSTTLAVGTVSTAYSQQLAASGGAAPYSWSIVAGSLPSGLSLSSGGLLSGTPTAAGSSGFTVQVTDSNSATATQPFTLVVNPGLVTSTISTFPAGLSLTVDGAGCTAPCTFQWSPGTSHSVSAAAQPGSTGVQYLFASWSDSGAASHNITAGANVTATFNVQYYLTLAANPPAGGSLLICSGVVPSPTGCTPPPSNPWYNPGVSFWVVPQANPTYVLATINPGGVLPQLGVAMNGPVNVTAYFTQNVLTLAPAPTVTVPSNSQKVTAKFAISQGDPTGLSGSCYSYDPNLLISIDQLQGNIVSVGYWAGYGAILGPGTIGGTCTCGEDWCVVYLPPVDVEDAGPSLVVTSNGATVTANSQVWISATPSLSLVASLVPAPGTNLPGNVSWQASFATTCCGPIEFDCNDPAIISAKDPWNLGSDIGACGGTTTVTATYGSYPAQSLTFSVVGTNPTKTAVNSYIGSSPWFLHQIVQLESGYLQFVASGAPHFGPPDGFGLMQVDPPTSTYQIWDWTQNATAGLAILAGFNADTYWANQLRNWNNFNASNPGNPLPPPGNTVEGPCTFSYNPTGGAYPFSDAVWIKRYNSGYSLPYIQFSQSGPSQAAWLFSQSVGVPPVDYVQVVCSATP